MKPRDIAHERTEWPLSAKAEAKRLWGEWVIDILERLLLFLEKLSPSGVPTQAEKLQKREKLLAFSGRLKQLAGRKGLRQKEIAIALGLEPSAVGQWFRARNFPGPSIEYRLSDLLGVHHGWLVNGDENAQNVVAASPGFQPLGASYGILRATPEFLREEIRERVARLIKLAGDDVGRLGWIREEIHRHLFRLEHWEAQYGVESRLSLEHSNAIRSREAHEQSQHLNAPTDHLVPEGGPLKP